MGTYTGSDKRLAYLFNNGGGGGGASALEDLSDVNLTSPTDGQALLYDAANDEWVNGTVQGGGGIVDEGTFGVRIDKNFATYESKTYTYEELGITAKGYYILAIATNHAETNGGWKWYGYLCYSGNTTSGYSYVKPIDYNNISVTMNATNKAITIQNTNGSWGESFRIDVLPLHPEIEVKKHAYSATEQVVGSWIDGKPIYERTVDLGVNQLIPQNSWYASGIVISDVALLIEVKGIGEAGAAYNLNAYPNNSEVMLQTARDGNAGYVKWVSIQYTKTTD